MSVYALIVENDELAKALILDHFTKGGITYAAVFKDGTRGSITSALDGIQESEQKLHA